MSRTRRAARIVSAIALALLAFGCSKSKKPTAPGGDDGGEHLLVFCTTRLSGTTSEYDVVLYDADQQGYRSLARGVNSSYGQSEPCLTDDGGYLCFASSRPTGAGGSDVYVYNRNTEELVATPGLNTGYNETCPRFTHDSVRMTFVRDSLGFKRIRLYEAYGDTLIPTPGITTVGAFDDDAPAPDLHGDRIAFQSSRDGTNHVYVWNRAGGVAALAALFGDSLDIEPALSSDGRWLAFSSNRTLGAGGYDVYLYDLQAGSYVRLPRLNDAGDERHPTISADGKLLFFAARADTASVYRIWRYTLADSNRTQPAGLASATGDDRQPTVRWR